MKAIIMAKPGGTEVLKLAEREDPVPGAGEALVEVAASGVNFMDVGARQGSIWKEMPDPKILGVEGTGRVLEVGQGVDGVQPGQRVAWVYSPGSYAEKR